MSSRTIVSPSAIMAKTYIEFILFNAAPAKRKVNPRTKVCKLSVAQQQIVEIAKALSQRVSVLILDEPSAVWPAFAGLVRLAAKRRRGDAHAELEADEVARAATRVVMEAGSLRRNLLMSIFGVCLKLTSPKRPRLK